jgi:hypothetical protein
LPLASAITVYRFFQEALLHVVKHADVASGRFVVLHDPAGQDGWRGDTRIVAFVSADVESEMAADPALAFAEVSPSS